MRETPLDAVRMYGQGVIWPADKETVVQIFQRNGAPEDVVRAIRDGEKHRYVAPSDITRLLWKVA